MTVLGGEDFEGVWGMLFENKTIFGRKKTILIKSYI